MKVGEFDGPARVSGVGRLLWSLEQQCYTKAGIYPSVLFPLSFPFLFSKHSSPPPKLSLAIMFLNPEILDYCFAVCASMSFQAKDGRGFLLHHLLQLEHKDKQPELWNTIVRELFRNNDRIPQSMYTINAEAINIGRNSDEVKRNVARGALAAAKIFRRLKLDIRKTVKMNKQADWNQDILHEALELLKFQIKFFSETLSNLKQGCKQWSNQSIPANYDARTLDTYGHLGEWLEKAEGAVKRALIALRKMSHHRDSQPVSEGRTISASTLRELLIRNELEKQREKIFRSLKSGKDSQQGQQIAVRTICELTMFVSWTDN
jgi:hypothetical protein